MNAINIIIKTITRIIDRYKIVLIVSLCFVIGCILLVKTNDLDIINLEFDDYHRVEYEGNQYRFNTDTVSILILGIDKDSNDDDQGQSDFISLALIDRGEESFNIITFPRDSMLDIRYYDAEGNYMGYANDHLSIAYSIGKDKKHGAMLVCDAISKKLGGIPINYFACIYLDQLGLLQNIVGEMQVVCPNNSLESVIPEWKEGNNIIINSDNVEAFVRKRDIEVDFSAISRQERQQVYIEAYLKALQNNKNAQQSLISLVQNNSSLFITNIPTDESGVYGNMLMNYSFNALYTIPGKSMVGKIYDEYHIDDEELQDLIIGLYYIREK